MFTKSRNRAEHAGAHEYRVTQPLNASLAELAGDVLGGLPDRGEEL